MVCQKMIPSFTIGIAVPALRNDRRFGLVILVATAGAKRPAMQAIEIVHAQIMRRLGGLSDP